jgi:hypothetical protein
MVKFRWSDGDGTSTGEDLTELSLFQDLFCLEFGEAVFSRE